MFVSVRDCMVMIDEFSSPLEGLDVLGVDAVEIELQHDFSVCVFDSKKKRRLITDADAVAYGKHLAALNVNPTSFLTACDFSKGDFTDNVKWIARSIELADILEMPVVRIDSAMAREQELTFGERVRLFSRGLGGALGLTSGIRVQLGIENHGFQGNNIAFLLNVMATVGNPRLGMTLDTGNFYWRGYPLSEVYGILAVLAPFAKHTHVKNIRYPEKLRETMREVGWEYEKYVAPIYEGDIDHKSVIMMLAEAGYFGDICLEDESLGHYKPGDERVEILKKDVEYLQELTEVFD